MLNQKLLLGIQCPNDDCNSFGPFRINGFLMEDDGNPDGDEVQWDKDSPIVCPRCGAEATVEHFSNAPTYELSENQKRFIEDAEDFGLEVNYTYSGRGMFGDQCPAVEIDHAGDFGTKARTETDTMGLGYVIYARR